MAKTLYSWLGRTDLDCFGRNDAQHPGPLASAVLSGRFDSIRILSNWPEGEEGEYLPWLSGLYVDRFKGKQPPAVSLRIVKLVSPIDFTSIYENVAALLAESDPREERTFHLSPGTPAMAAIWILVSSGEYSASLIDSSLQQGLRDVEIPFNIKAYFISRAIGRLDRQGIPGHFDSIIGNCPSMIRIKSLAAKAAPFEVPVLITGESGTGKELLAGAIHSASGRKGSFVAVNCGAIPAELLESEFFGHKKGSFTGAGGEHKGYIEQAEGGTLFLDEIGELPLQSQVKLLRALNDRKIRKIGDTKDIQVDVRVIAATNRDLAAEVEERRFRPDLFHRLAVALLELPPLRERGEDLPLLIDFMMSEINGSFSESAGSSWKNRSLSPEVLAVLTAQSWPGNVRELRNTLTRMILWADSAVIRGDEAHSTLFSAKGAKGKDGSPFIGSGFNLQKHLDDEAVRWLREAMERTGGNKSEAARILGFKNYQTLSNWIDKYGIS